MQCLKKPVRGSRVILTLVILIPLATAVTTVSSPVAANASPTVLPACQASQLTVTGGAVTTNTTYPVKTTTGVHQDPAYEVVPVYFYNRGTSCHILMGGPVVRLLRDTSVASTATLHDLSTPAGADNTRRPPIDRHQKIEALFVVVPRVGPAFKGCERATATGIVVGGYAKPISAIHFIPRTLRDVCFDTGVGRSVLDYGVEFPPTWTLE
jgi:hypothetical protein